MNYGEYDMRKILFKGWWS